jgi:hypothetical protein
MTQYGYEMKLEKKSNGKKIKFQKLSFRKIFHNDKIEFVDDESLFLPKPGSCCMTNI